MEKAYKFGGKYVMVIEAMTEGLQKTCYQSPHNYTEGAAKWVIKQMFEAIKYFHGRHLIHRDIKPDNFLFNLKGEVKLADLG